jgi:transcriptional regulator GlxA family with amidase domain
MSSDFSAPVSIAVLAVPETTPAALYGIYEVFRSVGVTWEELTGEATGTPPVSVRIVSQDTAPFPSPAGGVIAPEATLSEDADIVVVTDLALSPNLDPRGRWPAYTAWLRERFASGATICSVCTGAILLAEAGLLDGEVATTHWAAVPLFETCYPAVRLETARILSRTGVEGRIVTSGGAASWEDLALYLVARLRGGAEAVRIARMFLFGDRAEGQLPFAARPTQRHDDRLIAQSQEWIADHYRAASPVADMAQVSGLPERTFKRRFKAATGYTPLDYVQTLRIEEARQMLEMSGQPVDHIAAAVGYSDPAFFRRLFKRMTGITPARYRQKFSAIAMAGDR